MGRAWRCCLWALALPYGGLPVSWNEVSLGPSGGLGKTWDASLVETWPTASAPTAPRLVVGTAQAADRMVGALRSKIEGAEQEIEDLRTLFDGLDEGLAFVEEDDSVTLFNPAFEDWAGQQVQKGTRIGRLFRTPSIRQVVGQARRGEITSTEVEIGGRTVLFTARPHRAGALLVFRDLTAMRRLEDVRRDFVANVSHELKTPLTSVIGFAEALVSDDIAPPQAAAFSGRILKNAARMRKLVEDLLDLSLLESGNWTPEPAPVQAGAIARDVWDMLQTEDGEINGEITVEGDDEPCYADPAALHQVLRNLLDNALRYSDDAPVITIRVTTGQAWQRVEVRDQGPGIPSVHVERVFERFYRVDPARSRASGGTGLGLSIVRHFVETHGGKVGVESALGQGTTVWFTLPAAPFSAVSRIHA